MQPDLNNILDESRIIDLKSEDKEGALMELIEVISTSPLITDKKEFQQAIFEREKIISTGLGIGVAVPHVKIASVKDFVAALGRSFKGIDFQALDDKPVHIIVMIGASDKQAGEYLKVLARIIQILKDKNRRRAIMLAQSPAEIKHILSAEDGTY
ncbi:MAG: PTS sugar transporter subunit IIA [Candidatus Sumerlaeia bacterium]|nr:PTS sugar transporter subunit IIA [Candidatus Sumerlaeia bacterium]